MNGLIGLQAAVTYYFIRSIAATEVAFSHAGSWQVYSGEKLSFNCSAPAYHNIAVFEIGKNVSIEYMLITRKTELSGSNITHRYIPEGCNADTNSNEACSKIMNITVIPDMHGKSYQCKSYRRDSDPLQKYYSQGGIITVKDVNVCLTNPSRTPTPTPPTLTPSTTTVLSSPEISSTHRPPSPSTSPSETLMNITDSGICIHGLAQTMTLIMFCVFFVILF